MCLPGGQNWAGVAWQLHWAAAGPGTGWDRLGLAPGLGFWSDLGYNRAQKLPLSFCLSSPGKTGCFRLQMCPYLELKVLFNPKKLIAAVDSDVKISLDLTPPLT